MMSFANFLYSQVFVRPAYPNRSFAGETVLITGANVGLGLEAARHVVRLEAARVILGVRNVSAGEAAKEEIEASTGRPGVCEVWEVDLASFESVIAFGDRVAQIPRLDVALLNAAMSTPHFQLAEGYERTLTVNVISTMLLALLLLPRLQATRREFPSSHPHLTFVVSEVHGWVTMPECKSGKIFETLSEESQADMATRYPVSKLLEVLLVQELAGRVRGSDVIVNMLNPGLCHSSLGRDAGFALAALKLVLARSTEVGSRTLVTGASLGLESHGAYINDGHVENTAMSPFVRSDEGRQTREKLWRELTAILEPVRPGIMQEM